jgi:hypothetical protein
MVTNEQDGVQGNRGCSGQKGETTMTCPPDVGPDASGLVIQAAREYADEILHGVVTPYEGSRRIWKECQLKLKSGDHRLDPFVYWSSEFEGATSKRRRALCDKALRLAATLLVQHGSAL